MSINRHHYDGNSLVEPLHDTIKPRVIGFQEVSMTELAERTLKVHHGQHMTCPLTTSSGSTGADHCRRIRSG